MEWFLRLGYVSINAFRYSDSVGQNVTEPLKRGKTQGRQGGLKHIGKQQGKN